MGSPGLSGSASRVTPRPAAAILRALGATCRCRIPKPAVGGRLGRRTPEFGLSRSGAKRPYRYPPDGLKGVTRSPRPRAVSPSRVTPRPAAAILRALGVTCRCRIPKPAAGGRLGRRTPEFGLSHSGAKRPYRYPPDGLMGVTRPPRPRAVSVGDACETRGDGYETRGDACETCGDAYETRGGAYETRGDPCETRGDAYETRGDAYETLGDAYETRGDTWEMAWQDPAQAGSGSQVHQLSLLTRRKRDDMIRLVSSQNHITHSYPEVAEGLAR